MQDDCRHPRAKPENLRVWPCARQNLRLCSRGRIHNLYLAALLRILKEELDDKADTIEWWLYEDVRKCIWFDLEDGRRMRYDMPTAESLYNYLTLPFEQLPLEVES